MRLSGLWGGSEDEKREGFWTCFSPGESQLNLLMRIGWKGKEKTATKDDSLPEQVIDGEGGRGSRSGTSGSFKTYLQILRCSFHRQLGVFPPPPSVWAL